jgi:hypothetical protein
MTLIWPLPVLEERGLLMCKSTALGRSPRILRLDCLWIASTTACLPRLS